VEEKKGRTTQFNHLISKMPTAQVIPVQFDSDLEKHSKIKRHAD